MIHLFLLYILVTFFQQESGLARLIPYNKAGNWGVVDEHKKMVVPFAYQEIVLGPDLIIASGNAFSDVYDGKGTKICTSISKYVFPVIIKGKAGLIVRQQNGMELRYKTGEIEIQAGKYDFIKAEGPVFIVKKGEKFGLIDQNLHEIFPVVYKEIYVGNGIAVPFEGENSSKIISIKTLRPISCKITVNRMDIFQSGFFMVSKRGLTGLTDTLCREIVPPRYKDIYVAADLIYALKLNDKHDVYDKNGILLFDRPVLESETTAHYYLLSGKNKTVFYNKKLEPVLETDYDQVRPSNLSHLFYARKGRQWAVIDSTGKVIFPLRPKGYHFLSDDFAIAGNRQYFQAERNGSGKQNDQDSLTIIYRNGREVQLKLPGKKFGNPVANRLAVLKGGKVGFMNMKGEMVIPFIFDYDEQYEAMHYGAVRTFTFDKAKKTAGMVIKGREVTIDTTGKILADPTPVLRVSHTFSNGLQIVYSREPEVQSGILNNQGMFVRELRPGGIPVIQQKFLVLNEGNKFALFNQDMKQVTDFKYDQIKDARIAGLVFVSRDGISGYMTLKGEEYFE